MTDVESRLLTEIARLRAENSELRMRVKGLIELVHALGATLHDLRG